MEDIATSVTSLLYTQNQNSSNAFQAASRRLDTDPGQAVDPDPVGSEIIFVRFAIINLGTGSDKL